MREFKFRAWGHEDEYDKDEKHIIPWDEIKFTPLLWLNRNQYVFMQFTGLKDKDGVEIYEDDIVDAGAAGIRVIAWHIGNMGFVLDAEPENPDGKADRFSGDFLHKIRERGFAKNLKVIGNIHQHPELLPKVATQIKV